MENDKTDAHSDNTCLITWFQNVLSGNILPFSLGLNALDKTQF